MKLKLAKTKLLFQIIVVVLITLTLVKSGYSQALTLKEMSSIKESIVNINFLYLINIEMTSSDGYLYNLDLDLNFNTENESHQRVTKVESIINNISNRSVIKNNGTHFVFKDIKHNQRIPLLLNLEYQTRRTFPKITRNISYPYFFSNEELEELESYLNPTEIINYDSPVIQEQMKELISGEEDYYSLVMRISEFTKKNINYVLTDATKNDIKRASWVLINKEGVCDEITVLFIAFLRAAGIPARFVSGVAYSNIDELNPWGYHSWAEVYFPDYGWVPFDVTYGEFGYVDSLHIILSRPQNEMNNEISYSWKSVDTTVRVNKSSENFSFTPLNIDDFEEIQPEVRAYPEKTIVGFPSYNLINVELTNKYPYYLPIIIEAIGPKEVIFVDDNTKTIALKPFETKTVSFMVGVKSNLKDNYIYTMPVLVIINNQEVNTSFKVSKFEETYSKDFFKNRYQTQEPSKKILINCRYNQFVYVNESQVINCSFRNIGNETINDLVCLEESCYLINISPSEKKNLSFRYIREQLGGQVLTIKYLNRDEKLNVFVLPKPEIKVTYKIKGETNSMSNKSIVLSLSPKTAVNNVNLTLFIKLKDRKVKLAEYSIEKLNRDVNVIIGIDEAFIYDQSNEYIIKVDYEDKIKRYSVEKPIQINLDNLSLIDKIILWFRKISLMLGL